MGVALNDFGKMNSISLINWFHHPAVELVFVVVFVSWFLFHNKKPAIFGIHFLETSMWYFFLVSQLASGVIKHGGPLWNLHLLSFIEDFPSINLPFTEFLSGDMAFYSWDLRRVPSGPIDPLLAVAGGYFDVASPMTTPNPQGTRDAVFIYFHSGFSITSISLSHSHIRVSTSRDG